MLMAARKLQSIGLLMLVTICALAAYPVSLHVSSTRAELRRVETEIAATRRRIRMVEGEIAVLANMAQLERWNVDTFGYVAPAPGQYLAGERALANLDRLGPAGNAAGRAPILVALGPAQPAAVPRGAAATTQPDADVAPAPVRAVDDAATRTAMRDIARVIPVPAPVVTMDAAR